MGPAEPHRAIPYFVETRRALPVGNGGCSALIGPLCSCPATPETVRLPTQRPLTARPRASPGRSRPFARNTPRQPPLAGASLSPSSARERAHLRESIMEKNPHTTNETQPIVINRKSTIVRTTSASIDKTRRALFEPPPCSHSILILLDFHFHLSLGSPAGTRKMSPRLDFSRIFTPQSCEHRPSSKVEDSLVQRAKNVRRSSWGHLPLPRSTSAPGRK
jgi:hypothetical protein